MVHHGTVGYFDFAWIGHRAVPSCFRPLLAGAARRPPHSGPGAEPPLAAEQWQQCVRHPKGKKRSTNLMQ